MKPRTLRLHAMRHAKQRAAEARHQLARPAVWTDERVADLKALVPRVGQVDVASLGVPCSAELDKAAKLLIAELGAQERRSRSSGAASSAAAAQRIVVGLRQTHRDVETAQPRVVLLAKRVEGAEGKGTPLAQVTDIVATAKRRGIPIAAVLTRRAVCAKQNNNKALWPHHTLCGRNRLQRRFDPTSSVGSNAVLE